MFDKPILIVCFAFPPLIFPHCDELTGNVPDDLCVANATSALSDLFIGNNLLSGDLNFSNCVNLVILSAPFNEFTGALLSPTGHNHLHSVNLANNSMGWLPTLNSLIVSGHLTDINIAENL